MFFLFILIVRCFQYLFLNSIVSAKTQTRIFDMVFHMLFYSISFCKVMRRGRRLNCARQLQNLDGTFLYTITVTGSEDGTCSYRLHIVGVSLICMGLKYSGSQKVFVKHTKI